MSHNPFSTSQSLKKVTDIFTKIFMNTKVKNYLVQVYTPMIGVLLGITAIIDANQAMLDSLIKSSPVVLANIGIRAINNSNLMNNLASLVLNSLYSFSSISTINDKYIIEILDYLTQPDADPQSQSTSIPSIVKHIVRNWSLAYIIHSGLVPGFMDQNTYLTVMYADPMVQFGARNTKLKAHLDVESLAKTVKTAFMMYQAPLCNIHRLFMALTNEPIFETSNTKLSIMDLWLAGHCFLEQYIGIKIYSLQEYQTLQQINIYEPGQFIANIVARLMNAPISLDPNKVKPINRLQLTRLVRQALDQKDASKNINWKHVKIFRENIFDMATEYIPVYVAAQREFLSKYHAYSTREIILAQYENIAFDMLINCIERVIDIPENIDYIINYMIPIDPIQQGRKTTKTGQDIYDQQVIPIKLFTNKRFNMELDLQKEVQDFDSCAFHIPYEIMQHLKYLTEFTSTLYEVSFNIAKCIDLWSNPFCANQIGNFLVGNIVYAAAVDAIPIPELWKSALGFRSNAEAVTYLCYQLSHNTQVYNLDATDLYNTDHNRNFLNSYLLTAQYLGTVQPCIGNLKSITSGIPLYNRLCFNNFLDSVNIPDVMVVTANYFNYIANTAPDLHLTANITPSLKVRMCLNDFVRSPMDGFIKTARRMHSIVPGIYSTESMIFLYELTCGSMKDRWLEEIINTLYSLSVNLLGDDEKTNIKGKVLTTYNSGIFGNLMKFSACHLTPSSTYTMSNAGFLLQTIALNKDPLYYIDQNYYQPSQDVELNIVAHNPMLDTLYDRYILTNHDSEKDDMILCANLLGNNAPYYKTYVDKHKYFNKAAEVINLYEKHNYMLHILSEYSPYFNILRGIQIVNTSNIKSGSITVTNLQELVREVLRCHIYSPVNISVVQIHKTPGWRGFAIEDKNTVPTFIRRLNATLRTTYNFPHHLYPYLYHQEDGSYNPLPLDLLITTANTVVSLWHNSRLYDIKALNKHNMSPAWFNPKALYKAEDGFLVVAKANKMYELNGKMYIGNFGYEFGYKIKNNIFTISTDIILNLFKAIAHRTLIHGLEWSDTYPNAPKFVKNSMLSVGGFVLTIDLLGLQAFSQLIVPSKTPLVNQAHIRRYRLRSDGITEYAASSLWHTPLLAVQSCAQYMQQDTESSILANHQTVLGAMSASEFGLLTTTQLTDLTYRCCTTLLQAILNIVKLTLYVILNILRSIKTLGLRPSTDKIAQIKAAIKKEESKLAKEIEAEMN